MNFWKSFLVTRGKNHSCCFWIPNHSPSNSPSLDSYLVMTEPFSLLINFNSIDVTSHRLVLIFYISGFSFSKLYLCGGGSGRSCNRVKNIIKIYCMEKVSKNFKRLSESGEKSTCIFLGSCHFSRNCHLSCFPLCRYLVHR